MIHQGNENGFEPKNSKVMKFDVKVSREKFEKDLLDCLMVIGQRGKDSEYSYYFCEHTSLALYKKVLMVAVYEKARCQGPESY